MREAHVRAGADIALIDTELCGADVLIARFQRPEGYTYQAGQWGRFTLATRIGEQTRTFTHSSAPEDEWIELATRLSDSEFKQALRAMRPGDPVSLTGPGGRFVLPEGATRIAFLVGGVGVTPARSILRHAVAAGTRFDDAAVFYGNRDPSCVPYRSELEAMTDSGVRVIDVFERAPEDSLAEKGFITADLIRRHIGATQPERFYVSGPPPMVDAMVRVLDELGVARENRMIEWFGSPTGA
jgi:ferredoxin-NADP reductase